MPVNSLHPGPASLPEAQPGPVPPPAQENGSAKPSWIAFLAIVLLPAFWMIYVAVRYSVDVPYYDQWTAIAPMFQKAETGHLGFADFMAQNNEHRLPVPRVVLYAFESLTHWNARAEISLVVLVFFLVAVGVWKLLEATRERAGVGFYAVFAMMSLLVFDPVQDQNLTCGFQFHFVLPIAFIVAGLWSAFALRQPVNFVASALLSSAAMFSMALGIGSWFLVFPLLLLGDWPPAKRKWIVLWWGFALLNCLVYFHGYTLGLKPAHGGFRFTEVLQYYATYLGAPFAWGLGIPRLQVAPWVGGVFLAGVAAALVYVWRLRKESAAFRRALPWLLVMGIGLMNGVMITIGRLHFGVRQAMETRYVPYAVTIPIGLLAIGALAWVRNRECGVARSRWIQFGLPIAAAALFTLHFLSVPARGRIAAFARHDRGMLKTLVTMIDFADPRMLWRVSPDAARLPETVHALNRMGLLRPPTMKSASIAEIADPRAEGEVKFGVVEHAAQQGDRYLLSGWAMLLDRLEPADAVLLTVDDAAGTPIIYSIVEPVDDRPDIVKLTGRSELNDSGWSYNGSASALPPGDSKVKAWAYDADAGRAWRLRGETIIHR